MARSPLPLLRTRWLLKGVIPLVAGLFALAYVSRTSAAAADHPAALHAGLHLKPLQNSPRHQEEQIHPGTPVRLSATVANRGPQCSPAGELYLRYALSPPLENEAGSVIFETEKKPLPALEPSEEVTFTFETLHTLPSLLDFVRHDWPMREYQAIALIQGKESIIGMLTLTVSAHYYAQETQ